jgi:hypothetical protein
MAFAVDSTASFHLDLRPDTDPKDEELREATSVDVSRCFGPECKSLAKALDQVASVAIRMAKPMPQIIWHGPCPHLLGERVHFLRFSPVTHLVVDRLAIDDDLCAAIIGMKGLRRLEISRGITHSNGTALLTKSGEAFLALWPLIEEFSVTLTRFPSCKQIGGMQHLRTLELTVGEIPPRDQRELCRLEWLERFTLITRPGLGCGPAYMIDELAEALGRMSSLEFLWWDAPIEGDAVKCLAQSSSLKEMTLLCTDWQFRDRVRIEESGAGPLLAMESLKSLVYGYDDGDARNRLASSERREGRRIFLIATYDGTLNQRPKVKVREVGGPSRGTIEYDEGGGPLPSDLEAIIND